MSNLYLLIQGEKRGPYREEELRALLAVGNITEETLCRRAGSGRNLTIAEVLTQATGPALHLSHVPPRRSPGSAPPRPGEMAHTKPAARGAANRPLSRRHMIILAAVTALIGSILALLVFLSEVQISPVENKDLDKAVETVP